MPASPLFKRTLKQMAAIVITGTLVQLAVFATTGSLLLAISLGPLVATLSLLPPLLVIVRDR